MQVNVPQLIEFVKTKHGDQVRKYTNEPYYNHLFAVATMADGKCPNGFEIGLCHELLEDTDCTLTELNAALLSFGYSIIDAWHISSCVFHLTDEYTSEKYPELNRKTRKILEGTRLHNIRLDAQTVKYCDLINNTETIVKYDPGFAVKYLAEKRHILGGMNRGNAEMYSKCLEALHAAEIELDKTKSNEKNV